MKALHRPTAKMYAVKMIYRARFLAKEAESEKMFMREIQILKKLKHPNICTLQQVFDDKHTISGYLWSISSPILDDLTIRCIGLVLEYIPGGDLLEYIVKGGSLCMSQSFKTFDRVLSLFLISGASHR